MLFAPIRTAWVEGTQCVERVKSDPDFIWAGFAPTPGVLQPCGLSCLALLRAATYRFSDNLPL